MFHIGASKSTLTNVDVVKCGGDGYAYPCSTIVVEGDVEGLDGDVANSQPL